MVPQLVTEHRNCPLTPTSTTVLKGRAEKGVRREIQEGKRLAWFLLKHLHLG